MFCLFRQKQFYIEREEVRGEERRRESVSSSLQIIFISDTNTFVRRDTFWILRFLESLERIKIDDEDADDDHNDGD